MLWCCYLRKEKTEWVLIGDWLTPSVSCCYIVCTCCKNIKLLHVLCKLLSYEQGYMDMLLWSNWYAVVGLRMLLFPLFRYYIDMVWNISKIPVSTLNLCMLMTIFMSLANLWELMTLAYAKPWGIHGILESVNWFISCIQRSTFKCYIKSRNIQDCLLCTKWALFG